MANENPALILLIPGFAANERDTTCLPLQQSLVRSLKENYPDLRIIIIAFQYPHIKSTYHWHDVEVISMNGKGKSGINRLLLWYKIWRKLKQLRKQYTIKGLLSFWCGECAWVGNRFGRKYQIPHYCWILGQDAKKENNYVKRIKPYPHELIALSDSLQANFLKNHGIKPLYVIPPGIDMKQFPETVPSRDIDVIGVGSLIPLKQFDIFLDIIAEIKPDFPQIKALICGKGPEEEKLKNRISELRLKEQVTLTDELPYPEILRLMQRSKILLHPSYYEGFSGVCQEALYAGAHVISFQQAMNKIIEHWHIVVSKEEMREKLISLLRNSQLSHASVSPYLIENTVKSIMKLF